MEKQVLCLISRKVADKKVKSVKLVLPDGNNESEPALKLPSLPGEYNFTIKNNNCNDSYVFEEYGDGGCLISNDSGQKTFLAGDVGINSNSSGWCLKDWNVLAIASEG